MKKLFSFFSLPRQEKSLFAKAFFWVVVFRLGLWVVPYRKAKTWFRYDNLTESVEASLDWESIKKVSYIVRTCSRFVPAASCLTQALALRTLLSGMGQNSLLKFAVRRDEDGKFMAHAWVEIEGRIVIGKMRPHERFVALNPFDSVVV